MYDIKIAQLEKLASFTVSETPRCFSEHLSLPLVGIECFLAQDGWIPRNPVIFSTLLTMQNICLLYYRSCCVRWNMVPLNGIETPSSPSHSDGTHSWLFFPIEIMKLAKVALVANKKVIRVSNSGATLPYENLFSWAL